MSFKQFVRSVTAGAVAAVAVIVVSSSHVGAIDSREKMRQEAAAQSAKAAKAFDAIMEVPDKAIPRDLVAKAKAIAVFPAVRKVAFVVGGEGGRGVVSQRVGDHWGPPVFLRAGGGSVGPQIGASSTDLFVLLMNDESVDSVMKDRFGLGGEAGVAAGPVGRNAGAATDAFMHAAMLSYSRSRGVFAGLALKGVVIKAEDDLNLAVYNKTAEEMLKESPETGATSDLQAFPSALNRYTGQSSDR
jgi:lipid-binding SYLF domain-containing protein